MPSRMAIEVPISTMPLPPTISLSLRCCGRIAYFTGPKSADCTPPRKSAPRSSARFCMNRPTAPSAMTASSIATVIVISVDFSTLSAICPAVAENRKNGRMKRACARFCRVSEDIVVKLAVW